MEGENDTLWEAVARSLSKEGMDGDDSLMDKWLADNELNPKCLSILDGLEIESKIGANTDDKKQVFNDVLQRIQTDGRSQKQKEKKYYFLAAASIVILIALGTWFGLSQKSAETQQLVEVYSPKGVKSKLRLNDGTNIVLNAESKLTYPSRFSKSERTVKLEGEAYFEVAKDTEHPFIVNTNDIHIEVTGTKLNLKAYPVDKTVETTLFEGSLNISLLSDLDKYLSLKPREQAIFSKDKKNISVRRAPQGSDAWKDGKYIFKSMPFNEIAQILERGFNIKIDIQDNAIKNETFSGEFVHGESLVQILSIISLNEHISFQVFQDKVLIKAK